MRIHSILFKKWNGAIFILNETNGLPSNLQEEGLHSYLIKQGVLTSNTKVKVFGNGKAVIKYGKRRIILNEN